MKFPFKGVLIGCGKETEVTVIAEYDDSLFVIDQLTQHPITRNMTVMRYMVNKVYIKEKTNE